MVTWYSLIFGFPTSTVIVTECSPVAAAFLPASSIAFWRESLDFPLFELSPLLMASSPFAAQTGATLLRCPRVDNCAGASEDVLTVDEASFLLPRSEVISEVRGENPLDVR